MGRRREARVRPGAAQVVVLVHAVAAAVRRRHYAPRGVMRRRPAEGDGEPEPPHAALDGVAEERAVVVVGVGVRPPSPGADVGRGAHVRVEGAGEVRHNLLEEEHDDEGQGGQERSELCSCSRLCSPTSDHTSTYSDACVRVGGWWRAATAG